jgi:uncharacterized protein (UPF0333 family)
MEDQRPWYKKKRYLAALVILGIIILQGTSSSNSTKIQPPTQANTVQTAQTNYFNSQQNKTRESLPNPTLSNNNYYTNSSGNTVHSPAYANSRPSAASAQCRDGTYSFSQHRSGTCSHHGGVAIWY